MAEDESKGGRDRGENGGEAGRNELGAPEQQRIVEAQYQQASDRNDGPVRGAPGQRHAADQENRQEYGDRGGQTDRREGDRWQVTQADLDEEKNAAPDQTRDPPEDEGHSAECSLLGAGCRR